MGISILNKSGMKNDRATVAKFYKITLYTFWLAIMLMNVLALLY